MPLGRKFIDLFWPNSVAEYRVLFIFSQKTEQQTFHPSIFLAPKSRKMCPPLLKTCSLVVAQFNSSWRQRLTSFSFPCVLTADVYHRLRNLRRVFLRFWTVFSFRSIWAFVSFGKWRIFLTMWWKNWCEISTNNLVNKLFKVSSGSGRGGPDPAFPLLFHENPASRTFLIAIPNLVFLSQKYIKND